MAYINPQLRLLYEKNDRFFMGLSILLFLVLGVLSFTNFSKLSDVKAETSTFISATKDIELDNADLSVEFQSKEKLYTERLKQASVEMEKIFPENPDLTNFTRMIDDYFRRSNFTGNSAILKSMILGTPQHNENYTVTPVSMNITSSPSNFRNFLNYTENSGALKSDTRVMEIQSIDITFKEESDNEYDYRVSLNVYSKPVITQETQQ